MQTVLKIGGLVFSSGLTISLFIRLFGMTPFGLLMAVAALALFEGGAFGWAHLLQRGREAQRVVAGVALVIAVALSLFSSAAEIILATRLGAEALKALDFEFLTLCAIVMALSTNVVGALAYEANKPETRRSAQKLAFEGRLAEMQYKAQNQIMDAAELDADLRVETRAPELARLISDRALSDTQRAVHDLSVAGRDDTPALAQPVAAPIAAPAWPVNAPAYAAGGGGPTMGGPATTQGDAALAELAALRAQVAAMNAPAPSLAPTRAASRLDIPHTDLTHYTPGSHLHPTTGAEQEEQWQGDDESAEELPKESAAWTPRTLTKLVRRVPTPAEVNERMSKL